MTDNIDRAALEQRADRVAQEWRRKIPNAKDIGELLADFAWSELTRTQPQTAPHVHNVITGLDGSWHCQTCGERVEVASSQVSRPQSETAPIARPLADWHEDMGDVLWWKFPIVEPPYVGSPLDCGTAIELLTPMGNYKTSIGGWIDNYYTHFTPIPVPQVPATPPKEGETK